MTLREGFPTCIGRLNCRRAIHHNDAGYYPEDGRCMVEGGDGRCGLAEGPLRIGSDEDKMERSAKVQKEGMLPSAPDLECKGWAGGHLHDLVGQFVQAVSFDRTRGELSIIIEFSDGYRFQVCRAPERCMSLSKLIKKEGQ